MLSQHHTYVNIVTIGFVRHENFTWNVIILFYSKWQKRKIKIHKLHGHLLCHCHEIEHETGFHKIKIRQLSDSEANHKFYYHKISCHMVFIF